MNFKIGDWVTWESSAGGYTKKKAGVVVYLIPSDRDPFSIRGPSGPSLAKDYYVRFGGFGRKKESYLIAVPNLNQKRKPELYWPKVCNLRLTSAIPNEWTLICASCGWRLGLPEVIRRNFEEAGIFVEGTEIELMEGCEDCGKSTFVLKFLPKIITKTSTPTTPTQKGNGGDSNDESR